jgi:hypothetical protein
MEGRRTAQDTKRWSIPFAPEYPIEYGYRNDQVQGGWCGTA